MPASQVGQGNGSGVPETRKEGDRARAAMAAGGPIRRQDTSIARDRSDRFQPLAIRTGRGRRPSLTGRLRGDDSVLVIVGFNQGLVQFGDGALVVLFLHHKLHIHLPQALMNSEDTDFLVRQ